jgi:hypothetical protein
LLLSYLYGILTGRHGTRGGSATEKQQETNDNRPLFSTTIFDDSEEEIGTGQEDHQMLWFCVVIAIFFLGVAISYYIIHH